MAPAPAPPSPSLLSSLFTVMPVSSLSASSSSSSVAQPAPPSSASGGPSLAHLLLPLLPVLVLALLVLFLLRLLFRQCRHCLFLHLQMRAAQQQHQQQQQQNVTPAGQQQADCSIRSQRTWPVGGTANGASYPAAALQQSPYQPRSPDLSMLNEVAPWASEPCSPPLFLLQESAAGLFFPPGLDPVLLLEHPSLVSLLGPLPPKYEDAIKMAPSPPALQQQQMQMPVPAHGEGQQQHPPLERVQQPICLPPLQSRAQLAQQTQLSPPPCYTELDDLRGSCQPTADEGTRQQRASRQPAEQPPSYGLAASADDLTRLTTGSSAASVTHLALEDRPCSSLSLGSAGHTFLATKGSGRSAGRLNTFVAKGSARGGRRVPAEAKRDEEGNGVEMDG